LDTAPARPTRQSLADNRVLEAKLGSFPGCGVPGVRTTAGAGDVEESGVESGVDGLVREAVAVCGRGTDEPRGAARVAADRGDRGKAAEALGRDGTYTQLAAECEPLAKGVLGGVRVAGQQGGQAEVAMQDHP
jgi:hypothetical protein